MPKVNSARSAFTLLELIFVAVLLGIIALLSLVSLAGYLDQSSLVHAVHTIVQADSKERSASRQSPTRGQLEFDRVQGRIDCRNSKFQYQLDGNIKLIDIVAPTASGSNSGAISYAHSGQSVSYAVGLRTRRGISRWLVVIGMTGQIIECPNEEQARNWIRLMR